MVYIYRQKPSAGAVELAEALGGRKVRSMSRIRLTPDDVVICWGEQWPDGVNGGEISTKHEDAVTLHSHGVPTIEVSQDRPADRYLVNTQPPSLSRMELEEFVRELQALLAAPAPVWLARRNNHRGGNDLLNPGRADFYVKQDLFTAEYRVHSFAGKSIRAGKKVPREGVQTPHAWIRSLDGGWRISYDGVSITRAHRDLAHRAVAAFGLTFGAVDIGERADGSLVVLEVNRAPGLEGGTVGAYAQAIRRMIDGGDDATDESE